METKAEKEAKILKFWEEKDIYAKSKKQNAKGKKFYFMDGPPYATGYIHLGTALNKSLKDIAMRSQRLQGKDVFDRPGYDTHGVPIEFQVEKELGTKTKQDIETYGVEKFVQRCKEFATKFIGTMNDEFKNLGVWMDWNNPYITLTDEYIEAIWHSFKEADKKGILYLGKYPVHVCSRCATAVAYNEIEYGKQRDTSVFVKFPVVERKNTFLIIWTTTPWTLPANTGVMAHPDVDYQEIETSEGEKWIMAKELVGKVMALLERGFTPGEEFKGKGMEGWKYVNPIAKNTKVKAENSYRVVMAPRYVTTEDGTGLVHCAPGHGKEDYDVGKQTGLAMPCPVGISGLYTEEAGKYFGKHVRSANKEIIEDLKKEGAIVGEQQYEHEYPLCWRDKTPLLMISQPQWFLKISEIQKKILKENEKTIWLPSWTQLRMKAWLEGIGDWPVSRQRYWGTPLPIWYNEETGEKIVVGSLKELEKLSGKKVRDVHKPAIDSITIPGKKGKPLKRVPEVLDVWFDSGVSSWAALEYPREKEKFKKYWPADLTIEGKDQIRGWWNSQFILSEIAFEEKPFKANMMHGMILDLSKKKMSKSVGNFISPSEVIAKFGRDTLRYYFAKFSKGEDFSYDEKEMQEVQRFFTTFGNIHTFVNQIERKKEKLRIEDKWILSKYHHLVKEVSESYNSYRFPEVVQKIEHFVVFDLSRTYIQIIRDRSEECAELLQEIRNGLLILLAPITPFLTEELWQGIRERKEVSEESIHLSTLPKSNQKKIDEKLEAEFDVALRIIERGLAERDKAKIGLRWPLASVMIAGTELIDEMKEIVARQLNVKDVKIKKGKEITVELDTVSTPELEAEGFARELARKIQAERKNAGLQKGDVIELEVFCEPAVKKMLSAHEKFLKERTNSKTLKIYDDKSAEGSIVFTVKERKIAFKFS